MTVTHTHAKPTEKQLAYIESLSARAGYRYSGNAVKDCFGKNPVGGLRSRGMASELIDFLKSKIEEQG